MKNSITAVLIAVILATNLCACGMECEHDNYKEIYKRYFDMETFSATVEITVKTQQTESVFCAKQQYAAPSKFEMAIISPEDFAGSGYVFEKGLVTLKSGFGHSEVFDEMPMNLRSSIAITDFFEDYFKSEESCVETTGGVARQSTKMDCFCSGKNEKRYKQSLWVDNKTYLPLKMVTYDLNEQPVVVVVFKEFERNCRLNTSIFEQTGDKVYGGHSKGVGRD